MYESWILILVFVLGFYAGVLTIALLHVARNSQRFDRRTPANGMGPLDTPSRI